ncbi:MAG TPA: hypothetical protein VGK33_05685 [Chloroflexota bacterium]
MQPRANPARAQQRGHAGHQPAKRRVLATADHRHRQARSDVPRRERAAHRVFGQWLDVREALEGSPARPEPSQQLAHGVDRANRDQHANGGSPPPADGQEQHQSDFDAGQS